MKILMYLSVLFVSVFSAQGYIDPGTAGMVVGGTIWPIVVAIFSAIASFFIKIFCKPLKRGVSRLWQVFKRE